MAEPSTMPFCNVDLSRLSALVVDDDPMVRTLASELLRRCGARVVAAGSVPEAMACLEGTAVDVLVSDIQMPGQSGRDLIAMVRNSPRAELNSIPAVAMSGVSDPDSERDALQAGFDAFIAKPFRMAALLEPVCKLLGALARR